MSKNKLFNQYPQFIWGEAVNTKTEDGFDHYEYLIHCRYPRFLAKAVESLEEATGSSFDVENLESYCHPRPDNGQLMYACANHGLFISDFIFFEGAPDSKTLKKVCDEAVKNRVLRDDFLGINNDEGD